MKELVYIVKKDGCHSYFKQSGYKQEGRALRIAREKSLENNEEYEVISSSELHRRGSEIVIVKNLLTGRDVELPRSLRGTSCDPSRESYFTA